MSRLYDIENRLIVYSNLQEKEEWYKKGEILEREFISKYGDLYGLKINPEKVSDPKVPDLMYTLNSGFAELKTPRTPFFTSRRYNIDPQFAVSFNEIDYLRYSKFYPELDIYFWVDWQVVRYESIENISVEPMVGIWKLNCKNMIEAIGVACLHPYQQRKMDTKGNAKRSFVLDLSSEFFTRLV